jgi:hypothetical protein
MWIFMWQYVGFMWTVQLRQSMNYNIFIISLTDLNKLFIKTHKFLTIFQAINQAKTKSAKN